MKLDPITMTVTLQVTATPSAGTIAESLYHPPSRSAEDRQLIANLVKTIELMSAEFLRLQAKLTTVGAPCVQGCGQPGEPVEHDGGVVSICSGCRR